MYFQVLLFDTKTHIIHKQNTYTIYIISVFNSETWEGIDTIYCNKGAGSQQV